jgi:uncharacterized protein YndB with AHSA1/START domain
MAAETPIVNSSVARELTITRIFEAPRAIVFKAWTTPEQLMRWWGPHGFTCLSCTMDLRVGGAWRLAMRSPAGVEDRQQGVFREITPPERIVFTYAFVDFPERQTAGRWSEESGLPGHQTIVTVNFEDLGATTRLTVHQAVFENDGVRDEHIRGWGEALDRLAQHVITPAAKK